MTPRIIGEGQQCPVHLYSRTGGKPVHARNNHVTCPHNLGRAGNEGGSSLGTVKKCHLSQRCLIGGHDIVVASGEPAPPGICKGPGPLPSVSDPGKSSLICRQRRQAVPGESQQVRGRGKSGMCVSWGMMLYHICLAELDVLDSGQVSRWKGLACQS